jgi:hypothetical protein
VHPAAMMTYSLELVSPKLSVKVLTRWNSTDLTVNSLNRVIDGVIEANVIRLHMTTLWMEEGMLSGLYRTFPTLQHLWIEHDRLLTSTARKQMYENYDYTFDKFEKFILLDADTYDPNKALHIHYEISRCNNDILLSNSIIQNDKSNDINFDYKKAEIIIDTGATDSMFPWCIIFCKIYLYNKNTINELWRRVSFGDQKQGLTISGYGTVNLINTALYVPGLDQGVIGVGSLDKRGAYTGIFNGKLVVYDRTGYVILTAT